MIFKTLFQIWMNLLNTRRICGLLQLSDGTDAFDDA